ncbi:MAG: hypothetical protein RBT11_14205 [Desulfobacterales bacterium]|nr:hypothetical protein [Desulfobacterales bacterium]
MKIYNEIRVNIATGAVVYEDAFEYSGPIAKCGGGGGTTQTVDPVYNAGLLALSEENQAWANKLMSQYFYGEDYNPNKIIHGYYGADGTFHKLLGNDGEPLDASRISTSLSYNATTGVYTDSEGNTYSPITGWKDPSGNPANIITTTEGAINNYNSEENTSGAEYAQNSVNAQQSLLASETAAAASETALKGATAEASLSLLPSQTTAAQKAAELSSAQAQMGIELTPQQQTALSTGYELTTQKNQSALSLLPQQTAVKSSFYDSALKGVDSAQWADQAQTDAAIAFKNAGRDIRQQAALSGVNPNSGRFASALSASALDQAKSIGAARTQARTAAEDESFARLTTATGVS